ncbi:MAG TPA: hypothetical protein VF625_07220 [Longimicrobium sp.]|jgi:hypothetical protein
MIQLRRALLRAAVIAASFLAAPLAAQPGAGDAGTFRVYVQDREVGTEEFTIRRRGSGDAAEYTATGRVSLRLPTGTLELTPRLRARGLAADPANYQVDIGGDSPRTIVGTLGSGRFSARIVTTSGEQLREYVASAGALVLDEGIAHHYFFLAQRLRTGTVPIIVPRENRQLLATVSFRGEERMEIGGAQATLYHLVVRPAGGGEQHVWVDALNRVMRVDIPDRGYRAVRTAIPQ